MMTNSKEEEPTEVQLEDEEAGNSSGDDTGEARGMISAAGFPMVLMFVGSIILVTAFSSSPSVSKGSPWYIWGIVAGSVTMACSFPAIFLVNIDGCAVVARVLSLFLGVWNLAAAITITFWGPEEFRYTGNGYFSAWAMGIAGVMALGVSAAEVKQVVSRRGGHGLLASAVVLVISLADRSYYDETFPHRGDTIFSITWACLTVVLVVIALRLRGESMIGAIIYGTLAVGWIIAASLLTFRGPFLNTGNGYFASWGGVVCSIMALSDAAGSDSGEPME